jgi:hypothetical protein
LRYADKYPQFSIAVFLYASILQNTSIAIHKKRRAEIIVALFLFFRVFFRGNIPFSAAFPPYFFLPQKIRGNR